MNASQPNSHTAFAGSTLVARGTLPEVAREVKSLLDGGDQRAVLIFDDQTGRVVEVDFRGRPDDVLRRLADREAAVVTPAVGVAQAGDTQVGDTQVGDVVETRSAGRPKLGVVSREVTLLPRHWEWLGTQSGGASATIRRLVEQARRANEGADRVRSAREVTYRFVHALAGDEAGYEEALRALFAGQEDRFREQMASWPADVREYAIRLAAEAFVSGVDG